LAEPAMAAKPAAVSTSVEPGGTQATATAVFAGGCFWCTEATFEQLAGVSNVESGYAGGAKETADYQRVCEGNTGHAEAIRITYDPSKISYDRLLDIFFDAHDPTQLNRQGADVGTQYRSIILYRDEEQKKAAEISREKIGASGKYRDPIVTEIVPLKEFYPAEGYHQAYFARNPTAGYCTYVIAPKLKKLGLERK